MKREGRVTMRLKQQQSCGLFFAGSLKWENRPECDCWTHMVETRQRLV